MNQSLQQLELKHLAPYLPYELILYHKYADTELIKELNGGNIYSICDGSTSYKPLLIPLSQIEDELFDEIGFADEEDFIACVLDGSILHSNWLKLVERHYDVFGLIDAGLALNKMDFIK